MEVYCHVSKAMGLGKRSKNAAVLRKGETGLNFDVKKLVRENIREKPY